MGRINNRASVDRVVLLPCPFCGNAPQGVDYIGLTGRWVSCGNIGCASSNVFASEEQAIAAWNTRKSISDIERFIDREIELMDESGEWSTHAINALLFLQARVDKKLAELGCLDQ